MKFKIFSLFEIVYKTIIYLIVIIGTVAIISYYFFLEDKSDTFIVATLYATFLFIVGLYLSFMDKKIDDKIYERKDYYLTLLKLNATLNRDSIDFSTHDSAKMAIIAFKVLSGRSKATSKQAKKNAVLKTVPIEDLMTPPTQFQNGAQALSNNNYINQKGFVFTPKINSLENVYLENCSRLETKISDCINEYIKANGIQLKILGFHEMSLLTTDYESWCDEYISDTDDNTKESVKKYIYKIIDSDKAELDKLELQKKYVENYYKKCGKKVIWNIKRIESIYGNQLQYLINTNNEVMNALIAINEKLDNIERNQASYEQTSTNEDSVKDFDSFISEVVSRLDSTEENIMNAIDLLQFDMETIKEKY